MLNPQLTRRDFLKLATTGTLAFALSDLKLDRAFASSDLWKTLKEIKNNVSFLFLVSLQLWEKKVKYCRFVMKYCLEVVFIALEIDKAPILCVKYIYLNFYFIVCYLIWNLNNCKETRTKNELNFGLEHDTRY